jgi:hypothetical protein
VIGGQRVESQRNEAKELAVFLCKRAAPAVEQSIRGDPPAVLHCDAKNSAGLRSREVDLHEASTVRPREEARRTLGRDAML